MNVLLLTNPEHEGFVSSVVSRNRDHSIFTYWGEGRFEFVQPWSYDVGISFMYQYKVPAKEVNSHTWFNFHPAPLPDYKGRDLCYHAIINGDTSFGATLHYMDENFDTGEIIKVSRLNIPEWYTAEDLSDMAIAQSKDLFVKYLPRILAGEKFNGLPNKGGNYYTKGEIAEDVVIPGDNAFGRWVRAVTYKEFYPKIDIGGKTYKIVRDE